ncbi:MAG TPA: shikimate dehydrogenase [Syntrophales bacterium]|nr:shikimate dehydrogenase [Syntrophales bacterium]
MRNGKRFVLIGNPVRQSLSPQMHNGAYRELGIDASFEALCVTDLEAALRDLRESDVKGIAVTIPFKKAIIPYLDEVAGDALAVGAVNTVCCEDGRWVGHNTDGRGLARDLHDWTDLRGITVAVLGTGGAARAAVYAAILEGGRPVVAGRSESGRETLAAAFGCTSCSPGELGRIDAGCLINATPVGMVPDVKNTPVDAALLARIPRVVDLVYRPLRTRLLREAEAAGCSVRSGVGMFVNQGAEQIRLWTGLEPPRETMRRIVEKELENDETH